MVTDVTRRRLNYFVDRDVEVTRLLNFVADGGDRVMTVCGSAGLGKSLLMEKMIHECANRKWRTSKVICRDTRNDPLFIMRTIRDDLGVESFSAFTALVNAATQPPEPNIHIAVNAPVSVGNGAQVSGTAGDISGIKIVSDLMLDRPDLARREREQLARITDAFIGGLTCCSRVEPPIIFIDDCQKMTGETKTWLAQELLFAVNEGIVGNAFFVLFTRESCHVPLQPASCLTELKPLTKDHIRQYLAKRGVRESDQELMARVLWTVTKGQTAAVANYVEAYLVQESELAS